MLTAHILFTAPKVPPLKFYDMITAPNPNHETCFKTGLVLCSPQFVLALKPFCAVFH
jgi:hypothetical protein